VKKHDFESDLAAIRAAESIEDQVLAVERVGRAAQQASAEVVDALVAACTDPARQFLLFERLGLFGSLASDPLKAALPVTTAATPDAHRGCATALGV
jgi:hypothetical protein